jgi:PilZ domain-containing protein
MEVGLLGIGSKGPTQVFQRPMEPRKIFRTRWSPGRSSVRVVRAYPIESTFDFLWTSRYPTYHPAMGIGCPKPTRKPVTNTRHCARFPLHVPVFFTWKESERSELRDEGGVTRDVSIEGLFVTTSECPREGSEVELVVQLPQLASDVAPLQILSSGQVTRVESNGALKTGFSVCNRQLRLLQSGDFEGNLTN